EAYSAALALRPDWFAVANDLAWLWATQPTLAKRDTAAALEMASRACRAAPENASFHDTLAASQAALGHFDDAVATAERAAALPHQPRQGDVKPEIAPRLPLYRQHQASVGEPPPPIELPRNPRRWATAAQQSPALLACLTRTIWL